MTMPGIPVWIDKNKGEHWSECFKVSDFSKWEVNYQGYSRKTSTASRLHPLPGCVGSK